MWFKVAMLPGSGNKHAFLIMAHKDDATFRTLLRLLDDARNDIFVHMDAKNAAWDESSLGSLVKKAGCYAVNRVEVAWGGYSQIVCELMLLEAATAEGHYDFYHLLSGQDLPIKSQDEIHDFFDAHRGVEFVRYQSRPIDCYARVYGHRLWNRYGRDKRQKMLWHLDAAFSKIERLVLPRAPDVEFKKGDNWFSIGDSFARYVVSRMSWVEETFRYSFTADEVFLQTLLWNSPFRGNVYRQLGEENWDAIQRLIDWNRSNGSSPHVFAYEDMAMLRDSPLMFARKFDCEKDARVVEAIEALTCAGVNDVRERSHP